MCLAKCVVVVSLMVRVALTNVDIRTNLMRDKLKGYNPDVPPTASNDLPVELEIGFGIFSIIDINEKEQSMTTNAWINSEWTDDRLSWNMSEYNVINVYYKQVDIWVPDLAIANTLNERKRPGHDDMLCFVTADGRVSWMPGDLFKTTCQLDVTYFPFDSQTCKIVITTWMLRHDVVKLTPITNSNRSKGSFDTLYASQTASNGLWDIINISIKFDEQEYFVAGAVEIQYHLKRCPSFYIINLILPLICISVLICLVFALPMEQGDRVSLSMSILLSFVVFLTLLGDNLPKTSRQTSFLTIYLTILLIMSTLAVFLAVLILRMSTYTNSHAIPFRIKQMIVASDRRRFIDKRMSMKVDLNTDSTHGTGCARGDAMETITWLHVSMYLDRVLMIVFFIAVLLTNVIYFISVVILTGLPHSC